MKLILKKLQLVLFCLLLLIRTHNSQAQGTTTERPAEGNDTALGLSSLLGYNFNGKGDWSNLSPEIFLGFDQPITLSKKLTLHIRCGPTISTVKSTTEVSDYYRSIMLPGNGSISLNPYLLYETKFKEFPVKFLLAPVFIGAKVISGITNPSSLTGTVANIDIGTIAQQSYRIYGGLQFDKFIALSGQFVWGNHNLSSESERYFKEVFKQESTNVRYFIATAQLFLPPLNLYLNVNYRQLLSEVANQDYSNSKMITLGLRKEINLIEVASLRRR